MNIVFFLIIGAIAGWLAAKVMQGRGLGLWINMGLGVIGAVLGGTLLEQLDMQVEGPIEQLLTATFGAVIVLWLAGLIKKQ
ncbi:MAG: GlsB/YeaQ/YmgE family stress response membrane protein [Sedimenticolaceae bacterium]